VAELRTEDRLIDNPEEQAVRVRAKIKPNKLIATAPLAQPTLGIEKISQAVQIMLLGLVRNYTEGL
jgi:hypothetical protein